MYRIHESVGIHNKRQLIIYIVHNLHRALMKVYR